ncbi:uncharacterized protein LOC120331972 [Styela clava]
MAAVRYILLVLFAGALRQAFSQCDNTSQVINKGNGKFMSPNYPPNEYGKSASCLWKFKPPVDGKNYSLSLMIVYQRLYFAVGSHGGKDCSGNYSLFINNDKQYCERYISIHNPQFVTLMFYDSDSCGAGSPHQPFSPGVTVWYTSKGLLSSSNQSSMGFEIQYKFTECIEATTLHPTTVVPQTTFIETTTMEETTTYMLETTATGTTKPETQSTIKVTEKPIISQGTKTEAGTGDTGTIKGLSTTTVLFLVSIPGFIGIIILIASAIIYYQGRKRSVAQSLYNNDGVGMEEIRQEQSQEQGTDDGKELQTEPTDSSALYSTIEKQT